jgi:hypothetical protein
MFGINNSLEVPIFIFIDFNFVVPTSPVKLTPHHVGALWHIDCRIKNDSLSEVRLYQDGVRRKPDDRILMVKKQVFTLLSKNISDIGEYSCEYCNKSKTVGRLIAGILFITTCILLKYGIWTESRLQKAS